MLSRMVVTFTPTAATSGNPRPEGLNLPLWMEPMESRYKLTAPDWKSATPKYSEKPPEEKNAPMSVPVEEDFVAPTEVMLE